MQQTGGKERSSAQVRSQLQRNYWQNGAWQIRKGGRVRLFAALPPFSPHSHPDPSHMIRCCLLLCFALALHADNITIQKSAGSETGNPTLSLRFDGPQEVSAELQQALQFCGWFKLVPGDAVYDLQVSYRKAHQQQLEVRLHSAGNQLFGFRNEAQLSVASKELVFAGVDEVIKRQFRVPGPCSAKLAYVKQLKSAKEIWLADFHGGSPQQLTYNGHLSVEPEWGPNGRFLTYTNYGMIGNEVRLIDTHAMTHRSISAEKGLNSNAAISNSGKYFALCMSADDEVEVYVKPISGKGRKRITKNAKIVDTSPCWSPDDRELCFVSDRAQVRPTLYVAPANGGTAERVLVDVIEAVSPDWCRVSNRICFALRRRGGYRIAYVDMSVPRKSREIQYAHELIPGDWEEPTWSRDGRHIVCARSHDGQRALYLLDTKFKTATPLQNFTGSDSLPAYSP